MIRRYSIAFIGGKTEMTKENICIVYGGKVQNMMCQS